jgi:hypothetical protein
MSHATTAKRRVHCSPTTRGHPPSARPTRRADAVLGVRAHADRVSGVQVWGDAAEVRFGSDVLFLRLVSGHWRVSAAGCTRQPVGPYDCKVGG